MYKDHRISVVIPAGRKESLSICLSYLLHCRLVDEIVLFRNTTNAADLAFIDWCQNTFESVGTADLPQGVAPNGSETVRHLYDATADEDTVYIKCDDDIVFFESDAIENLLKARFEFADAPFVSANVVNNSMCYVEHLTMGCAPALRPGKGGAYNVHRHGAQGETVHKYFLERMKTEGASHWIDFQSKAIPAQRWSINCIAYFGRFVSQGNFRVGPRQNGEYNDEIYITTMIGDKHGTNAVCGNAVVAHYAFFRQYVHLQSTDILARYRQLARDLNGAERDAAAVLQHAEAFP